MRPDVGASTPVITLISVDLPAPLSPISPTISLRPMASEMSRKRLHGAEVLLHVLEPHDVVVVRPASGSGPGHAPLPKRSRGRYGRGGRRSKALPRNPWPTGGARPRSAAAPG